MKFLLIGANGYIGRHVVKAILDKGEKVIACDIVSNDVDARTDRITLNFFPPKVNVYEQLGSPDVCLHMAWRMAMFTMPHTDRRFVSSLQGLNSYDLAL